MEMGRFSINFTYLCLSNPASITNAKIDWPFLNPQGHRDSNETKMLIWERMKTTPRPCRIRNVLGITECTWNVPGMCSESARIHGMGLECAWNVFRFRNVFGMCITMACVGVSWPDWVCLAALGTLANHKSRYANSPTSFAGVIMA
jgi:hypothetical protein